MKEAIGLHPRDPEVLEVVENARGLLLAQVKSLRRPRKHIVNRPPYTCIEVGTPDSHPDDGFNESAHAVINTGFGVSTEHVIGDLSIIRTRLVKIGSPKFTELGTDDEENFLIGATSDGCGCTEDEGYVYTKHTARQTQRKHDLATDERTTSVTQKETFLPVRTTDQLASFLTRALIVIQLK